MDLVDSSGRLKYLVDGKNTGMFVPSIEETGKRLASTINIYEVYKKLALKKDKRMALQIVELMQEAKVVRVSPSTAMQAAKFRFLHKMAMTDSIIYATTLSNYAVVLTQDSDFEVLEGVKYYRKK